MQRRHLPKMCGRCISDPIEGFWKGQFGHTHGIMVVNAFYENVNRHKAEGRELADGEAVQNLGLEFRPRPTQDMLVACLWLKYTAASFRSGRRTSMLGSIQT